jgi:uncharacterized protein YjiK
VIVARPVLLLALALAPATAAERDARAVLADHLRALGAADRVRALSARGTLQPAQGERVENVVSRWRLPGEFRREFPFGRTDYVSARGVFVERGTIERYRPEQRKLRGGYYLLTALARPFPLLELAKDPAAVAALRVGRAEGHEVLATPPDRHGVETVFLVHERTHLLASVRFVADSTTLATVVFDQHRERDGVPLPGQIFVRCMLLTEDDADRKLRKVEWTWHEQIAEWNVDPETPFRAEPEIAGVGGGAGFRLEVFPCGPDPHDVAAADLDRDGAMDLAAACDGGLSVLFGGANRAHVFVPLAEGHLRGLAVDDLDLDGTPDLVSVSNVGPSEEFHVVSFDARRAPDSRRIYGAPPNAQRLATADLDFDGLPDLVTTGGSMSLLDVKFGNGAGGVRLRGTRRTHDPKHGARRAAGVAVGDIDGDGLRDILVADGKQVVVYQGNVHLGLVESARLDPAAAESLPVALALADLDGDGRDDLVVVHFHPLRDVAGGELTVLRNTGSGFSGAGIYDAGRSVQSVAAGDFDGDGNLDVAAASFLTGEVVVLHGDGNCRLGREARYATGLGPCRLAAGDFNGDGRDDILVSNRLEDTLALLVNTREFAGRRRRPEPRAEACPPPVEARFELKGLSESYAFAGEFRLPERLKDPSGIAYFAGDDAHSQFVVVSDKTSALFRLTLDRVGRRLLVGPALPLRGLEGERLDLEAVAFDRESATLFLGCEADSSVLRVTAFGHVLGRAKTPVELLDNDGLEALALRRRVDGTPLLYVFKERVGATGAPPPVHVVAVSGEPLLLEPRATLHLPVPVPDQTDAAFERGRFFVVSRLTREVLEVFPDDDGFAPEAKRAGYAALTDGVLGLVDARMPLFGLVEGVAIDHRADLFLVVDHNGATIGKEGLNRGAQGRLLWFRNLEPPPAPAPVERVAVRQIVIGFDGSVPPDPSRTREEAKALAERLFRRAKAGEDLALLANEVFGSKGPPLEVFRLVQDYVRAAPDEIRRATIPEGAARTAFGLAVGEVGLCEFHAEASPQGWRVLQRVE